MKKNDRDNTLSSSEIGTHKDLETNKIKTTNVNILLNRVRLDQKRTLKKRIIFTFVIAAIVSSLAIYFIIWFKKFIETIKIYIINHLSIKAG